MGTITDAMGEKKRYEYDLLGRLVKEYNELNQATEYTYDALGRVINVTNPLGYSDSFTYDALGRIETVTDKNNNVTKYFYDANGNVIETKDALEHSSYFEYDAMNRLKQVELYRVDEQDGVNERQITRYEYDKRGLVTREINAAEDETLYVYDGNGNLVSKTDADGYVTEFGYDPRNLVESINYSNEKNVTFLYDKAGRLIEMEDWNGTTTFALDLLGRIASVNDHNGKTVSYTYDKVGNKTSMTYPDGSVVNYTYDLLGRLTNVTETDNVKGDGASYMRYDEWGAPIKKAIITNSGRYLDLVQEYNVHPWDQVLGLYYAKARMYDAEDRRFASADWVKGHVMAVQTLNRYIYVLNNPLKFVDLWGLAAIEVIDGRVDFFAALRALGLSVTGSSFSVPNPLSGSVPGPNDNYFTYSIFIPSLNNANPTIFTTIYRMGTDSQEDVFWKPDSATNSPMVYRDGKYLIDVEYFQQLMCNIGIPKGPIGKNGVIETFVKLGLLTPNQNQVFAFLLVDQYYATDDQVRRNMDADETTVLAFEGAGSYIYPWTKSAYHKEGRYGAMMLVMKGTKATFITVNASTLPDDPIKYTTVKDGIYSYHSGLHKDTYAALRPDDAALPGTRITNGKVGDKTITGANIHAGSGGTGYSEGCQIIYRTDYVAFALAVGYLNAKNVPEGKDWGQKGANISYGDIQTLKPYVSGINILYVLNRKLMPAWQKSAFQLS